MGGGGLRPGPFQMQAGDHLFSSDSLEEVGLQNHVDVGGWGEKSLASRIPPRSSGSEHPYSHFLLCFLCSPTLLPELSWERKHQAGPERCRAGWAPLSLHCALPPPLQALKIIYVCKLLLTHMSYSSCLPTGLGMGEFSNRRAEKSGRRRKEHGCEVGSPGIWSGSTMAMPPPPMPRPLVLHLQMRRWV